MSLKNLLIICTLILPILLLGCKKDKCPQFSNDDVWACYNEKTWDSLQIKNTLIGEWKWACINCSSISEMVDDNRFDGLTIDFNSNNSLEVKEDGQTTQTSTWKVVYGNLGFFRIDVSPAVDQLDGIILLCDDRLEFQLSQIDLCDNHFIRKD